MHLKLQSKCLEIDKHLLFFLMEYFLHRRHGNMGCLLLLTLDTFSPGSVFFELQF